MYICTLICIYTITNNKQTKQKCMYMYLQPTSPSSKSLRVLHVSLKFSIDDAMSPQYVITEYRIIGVT